MSDPAEPLRQSAIALYREFDRLMDEFDGWVAEAGVRGVQLRSELDVLRSEPLSRRPFRRRAQRHERERLERDIRELASTIKARTDAGLRETNRIRAEAKRASAQHWAKFGAAQCFQLSLVGLDSWS